LPVTKEKSHLIVPVFIPHQGCPHQCIYCRQDKITDRSRMPLTASYIKQTLDTALESKAYLSSHSKEVAFYGGTFTNLPGARMKEMLETTAPYLKKGLFNSIRISTRPDSIDRERLELIRSYGVSTVELGVQSMDDRVLMLSKRGHTSDDTIKAVALLKEYGFKVGAQLMPGLPGDSGHIFRDTVKKVLDLKPDMARLYPTVVIRDTELASVYHAGGFIPLTLDEAVGICADSCVTLEDKDIPVIRIGLMSSPSLLKDGEILAGPWHTAFGFLVRSRIHQKRIEGFLPRCSSPAVIGIRAPMREIPLVRGYKNEGVRLLEERSGARIAYIKPDDSIPPGRIEADELKQGTGFKVYGTRKFQI
jgi:histone acetyltransferase (RNA polymerase elongator complex component)